MTNYKELRITDKQKITELFFNHNCPLDANCVKVLWVTLEPSSNGGVRYRDAYALIGNNNQLQRAF